MFSHFSWLNFLKKSDAHLYLIYTYIKYGLFITLLFLFAGCKSDTSPQFPILLPHSLMQENNISEFTVEYFVETGFGVEMHIYFKTQEEAYYIKKILSGKKPSGDRDFSIRESGINIPIQIKIVNIENTNIIIDEIINTTEMDGYNSEMVSRGVYGKILPVGKYKISIKNLSQHAELNFPVKFFIYGRKKA